MCVCCFIIASYQHVLFDQIAMGPCVKNKWVTATKMGLVRIVEAIPIDSVQEQLQAVDKLDAAAVNELKKRKLVTVATIKSVKVQKVQIQ
jgi:hypothetical protein